MHAQVLDQADEDDADEECLVGVGAEAFQFDDDVLLEQGPDIERMASFEEPPGTAQPQAPDAHVDEPADVVGYLPAVSDVLDDLASGNLLVGEARPPRRTLRAVHAPRLCRLAGSEIPAAVLVAAQQRPARYGDRLVAVPTAWLLADPGFRARLAGHGVPIGAAPVGDGWYLRLLGGHTVSLAPAYHPVSRRLRPEPSTLLRPEHGLVPFLGRQAVLNQVTGWCQDPAGTPVLLVIGGGGSGKTRLGREACVRMLVAGWDAGLADDKRRDGTATTRLQRPTLVVVDDADLRTGLISGLVDYLRWDDAGPPVRLLLLARAAGAWWDRLVRQQELASAYMIVDLDRHPVPLAGRADHFRRASTAFAAYGGADAQPADPPTELDDPAYAEPLLIHIAALLRTVQTSATPPPPGLDKNLTARQPGPPVRQRLLRALCERERTRWYELGEESHLSFNPDLPLVDQAVALATLTAAGDQPCAMSLLAALPNQAEVTRIGAEALVVWAHRLYSGTGYWNPLRPDLLAEQHLADTAQVSHLAITAAQLATGQRWEAGLLTQLLAELTRGTPNQPAVRAALDELLAASLPRIVDLAATTAHAELADLASLALQLAPQPGLAAALADQMPEHSVRLVALAATLTSQQVTKCRAGIDGGPDAADRLAGSLNDLSVRLGDLGRPEEALAASEEAVSIRRELAAARPDAYRPDLALSLHNLSVRLADLGRPEEALAASEEAAETYRELAGGRPDTYRPYLAGALNNLSVRLGDLGRPEEALAAIQEAAETYRELAAARPDAYRPDLALSLHNLSVRLGDLGRPEEALAAIQEAAETYRELAAGRPDAYRPDLAGALNHLSVSLGDLGRPEEALAASEEAVSIRRELAAARPDAYRPDLAGSLHNLSVSLGDLGRPEEALAAIQEAAETYRELAAARPDAYRPDLALSLHNLSIPLGDLGRPEEALAASEEAVSIRRELAAGRPDAYRPDLARSLHNLSVSLAELGRPEEALAASEEAVSIRRELAAARPDAYRPDLAGALHNLSVRLADLGRPEEALAAIQEAAETYRELAAGRPDAYRPDLAGALHNLSVPLADWAGRRRRWPRSRRPPKPTGSWPRPARMRTGPTWPCRCTTYRSVSRSSAGRRRRWPRSRKPSASAGSWLPGGPVPATASSKSRCELLPGLSTATTSATHPRRSLSSDNGPLSRLAARFAAAHGLQRGTRAGHVTVEAQHPRDLVALAAPGWPSRSLPLLWWQFGGREAGGQYRVRVAHTGGGRARERGQRLRQPARLQHGLHGRGQPGPLVRGQPPAVAEVGEELADRRAAVRCADRGRDLARVRGGGGRFYGWFPGRFGCNRRTP